MTHHVGYTLQFEQALQLVDPSVSIPYWEYTIEGDLGVAAGLVGWSTLSNRFLWGSTSLCSPYRVFRCFLLTLYVSLPCSVLRHPAFGCSSVSRFV